VGFVAPSILVHGLLNLMNKGSKIVNLSGTFENGAKGWLPYYSSKRALEDFSVGLSDELEEKDIQVNCVSPSDTATEQYSKYFPEYMAEAIDPLIIAKKIVELCDKNNKTTGKVFVMQKDKEPLEKFHA
jgi:NAD(P)-dependent dehydrogenase (short-subunit alcohol dehydrogenase family)